MNLHCPECGSTFKMSYLKKLHDELSKMFGGQEKKRSSEHNARHHKVIKLAFDAWPVQYRYQPATKEHLRKWLYIQVGFYNAIRRPGRIDDSIAAELEAVMDAAGRYSQITVGPDWYEVHIAKSTAFPENGGDLKHGEAVKLFTAVDELICSVLDIESTSKLIEESKRAA